MDPKPVDGDPAPHETVPYGCALASAANAARARTATARIEPFAFMMHFLGAAKRVGTVLYGFRYDGVNAMVATGWGAYPARTAAVRA